MILTMTKWFYKLLAWGMAIFFIHIVLHFGLMQEVLTFNNPIEDMMFFLPMLWVFIFVLVIYVIIYNKIEKLNKEYKVCFSIFILTATPRLALTFFEFDFSLPVSDFWWYWSFGDLVNQGDYYQVANRIAAYRLPWMGGLAVYNSLIARFFGSGLIGFYLANIITTSIISILMYLIAKSFTSRKVALIASLLFALYPSNIAATQLTTNMHHIVMWGLFSVYFLQKTIVAINFKTSIIFSILSMLSLCIAYFMHSADTIYFIALVLFSGVIFVNNIKGANSILELRKRIIIYMLILVIGYVSIPQIGLHLLYRRGIINTFDSASILELIALGTDLNSPGRHTNESRVTVRNAPPEEQRQVALSVIQANLQEWGFLGSLQLIRDKSIRACLQIDNTFFFYVAARRSYYTNLGNVTRATQITEFQVAWGRVDAFMVSVLFLFAAIVLFLKPFTKSDDMFYLMIIVVIGFVITFALGENQPRYRYLLMPYLIMIASVSLFEIKRIYEEAKPKIIKNIKRMGGKNYEYFSNWWCRFYRQ